MYSVIEYFQVHKYQTRDGTRDVRRQTRLGLLANILVTGAVSLVLIMISFKLYLEFGWKIYKRIGADPKIRGNGHRVSHSRGRQLTVSTRRHVSSLSHLLDDSQD
jgi:hypothetical protein